MKLEINLINGESQEYNLNQSSVYVGRSSQCDVIINHESMSRKHCLIEISDGKIFITDLGSTNGVSIDGVRITPNEKTFYLNSLPLMIGAAQVSIDLTDHQTKVFSLSQINKETKKTSEPSKPVITKTSSTGTHKNLDGDSETRTRVVNETKISKTKPIKAPEKKSSAPIDPSKKRELFFASIAVGLFLLMALWYFTQN